MVKDIFDTRLYQQKYTHLLIPPACRTYEIVSPARFLTILKKSRDLIKGTKFIPPRLAPGVWEIFM